MTKRFLVSAATVALMAGTGFAYAQGTGMNRDAAGGSTAQQNAPDGIRLRQSQQCAPNRRAPTRI